MRHLNFMLGAAGVMLLAGCAAPYTPPPVDFDSTSFSQRKTTGADELLRDVELLSLEQAMKIAIANNPSYLSAYYAVNAARMRYYQAMGSFSPTIDATFDIGNQHATNSHRVNTSGANRTTNFGTSVGIQANWLIFNGFSRYFQLKISESEETATEQLREDDCRLLLRAISYAYNEILLQIENKRIAKEDMDFQRKSLQYSEAKFNAGAVPRSDVLNFQIYVNTAEGNWITAQYQLETAVYALAVLMGYPEGVLPEKITFPAMSNDFLHTLPGVDLYLDSALRNRPDLKSLREQMTISDYQLKQTYSAYSPSVSLYAGFGANTNLTRYHGNQPSYHHSYSDGITFNYGAQANWNIFSGFIRYNRSREAMAQLAQSHYAVADKWLTVIAEVRNSYANYLQSVRQTNLYARTLDLTSEQRDLVDAEYRAGNTELTRLNEAQRDLVSANSNLATSRINVYNAKAQLEAASAINTVGYYHPAYEKATDATPQGEAPTLGNPLPGEPTPTADPKLPQPMPEMPDAPKISETAVKPETTAKP